MHHYPHHIGDFNNATRHLTRVERSLYRDAIDLYYDTEQPLPADDFDRLARRLLANSDEERSALRDVLNEFFTLDDGFYHHARCDAEIAKYRASAESKSKAGKASAAKRQQKATPVELVLNECATNQEPRTKNQEPIENLEALSGKPDLEPPSQDSATASQAREVLEFLNAKSGRRFMPTPVNLKMIQARLREGYSVQDLKTVTMRKVRDWATDEKMAEFIRPKTLFNATNFNSYAGILSND